MYNQIILVGIVVSIIFTEITAISPAGLIVPSYIALCLRTPERIIYTIIIALLAWGVSKILNNFIILYGRRRFAMMIILSYSIDFIIGQVVTQISLPTLIGVLIPGIMASEFEKQGVIRSLVSLGIVVGIILLISYIFGVSLFRI